MDQAVDRDTARYAHFAALAEADGLWRHWGFGPWAQDGMAGVWRRVTFTKGALLGEVARYYAHDYIVWIHGGESDCLRVFENWKPVADVMLHRFVFIMDPVVRPVRKRSFLLGLKGYLEVYQHRIGEKAPRNVQDLASLIDKGWRIVGEDREVT